MTTRKQTKRPDVEMPDSMTGVIEGNIRKADDCLATFEAAGWTIIEKSMDDGPRFTVRHAIIERNGLTRRVRWNPKGHLEAPSRTGEWFPLVLTIGGR